MIGTREVIEKALADLFGGQHASDHKRSGGLDRKAGRNSGRRGVLVVVRWCAFDSAGDDVGRKPAPEELLEEPAAVGHRQGPFRALSGQHLCDRRQLIGVVELGDEVGHEPGIDASRLELALQSVPAAALDTDAGADVGLCRPSVVGQSLGDESLEGPGDVFRAEPAFQEAGAQLGGCVVAASKQAEGRGSRRA